MNINELIQKVHQNAKDHGWWDEERSLSELLCLIHSEVSEALEEDRNHRQPTETYYSGKVKLEGGSEIHRLSPVPDHVLYDNSNLMHITKPEGVPSELADVVIRVMDICGHYGINLEAAIDEKMEYNRTRPMRHGGKKL